MSTESKPAINEHEVVLLFAELMWEYELTSRLVIQECSDTPRHEESQLLDRLAYYERSLNEILDGEPNGGATHERTEAER